MTMHRPIADTFRDPEPTATGMTDADVALVRDVIAKETIRRLARLPCVCAARNLKSSDGLCYCGRKPDRLDRQVP